MHKISILDQTIYLIVDIWNSKIICGSRIIRLYRPLTVYIWKCKEKFQKIEVSGIFFLQIWNPNKLHSKLVLGGGIKCSSNAFLLFFNASLIKFGVQIP